MLERERERERIVGEAEKRREGKGREDRWLVEVSKVESSVRDV